MNFSLLKSRVLPIQVLSQCGRVDDIVSAIGFSWWQKGPVALQSKHELESSLNSLVVAPFVAYKTFISLVKDNPNGSYTFVTGETVTFVFAIMCAINIIFGSHKN